MFGHIDFNMFEHICDSVLTLSLRITATMNKPRFADIARHLKEGITSGHYPVGTLLPTEMELRDHYKTSRHTVRAALQELQQMGLVSRRKNVGTRVESATPQAGFQQALASVEDLVQFGADARARWCARSRRSRPRAHWPRQLGCAEGTRWLRISSLRMDEERGRAADRLDRPVHGPGLHRARERVRDAPETLVSTLIEQHYGRRVVEIVQQVQAVAVTAALARRLRVEPARRPCRSCAAISMPTATRSRSRSPTHPAERFSLTMRLQRAAG